MPRKKAGKRRKKRKSQFDQGMDDFGEEVEALGKRFEKKGDEWESWFHRTFGIVGPFISGIFGLLILVLIIWVMNIVNIPIGSSLVSSIGAFLLNNLGLFFLIFLFFSYSSYFSRAYPRAYMPFSPLVTAFGIIIGLWIFVRAINIVNLYLEVSILNTIAFYIDSNIYWIFLFVAILGYLILLIKISSCKQREDVVMRKAAKTIRTKRLYRSGKDKILGGVCGGIGEYLGVDPVIIRLLWVISFFAWGVGVLPYIVAWIIIPRNPKHKWKD